MASSTSSRPNSRRRRYDVYINMTGNDVSQSFIDDLHNAVKKKKLTYTGWISRKRTRRPIIKDILKKVEASRYAIVVISKQYASFPWCLDRLVKMMKCKKDKRQIVLPVFYRVDPSDVYHKRGTFAKHFDKHMGKTKTDQLWSRRVRAWSHALKEVTMIHGSWHLAGKYSRQTKDRTIKEIIQRISSTIPPKVLTSEPAPAVPSVDKKVTKKGTITPFVQKISTRLARTIQPKVSANETAPTILPKALTSGFSRTIPPKLLTSGSALTILPKLLTSGSAPTVPPKLLTGGSAPKLLTSGSAPTVPCAAKNVLTTSDSGIHVQQKIFGIDVSLTLSKKKKKGEEGKELLVKDDDTQEKDYANSDYDEGESDLATSDDDEGDMGYASSDDDDTPEMDYASSDDDDTPEMDDASSDDDDDDTREMDYGSSDDDDDDIPEMDYGSSDDDDNEWETDLLASSDDVDKRGTDNAFSDKGANHEDQIHMKELESLSAVQSEKFSTNSAMDSSTLASSSGDTPTSNLSTRKPTTGSGSSSCTSASSLPTPEKLSRDSAVGSSFTRQTHQKFIVPASSSSYVPKLENLSSKSKMGTSSSTSSSSCRLSSEILPTHSAVDSSSPSLTSSKKLSSHSIVDISSSASSSSYSMASSEKLSSFTVASPNSASSLFNEPKSEKSSSNSKLVAASSTSSCTPSLGKLPSNSTMSPSSSMSSSSSQTSLEKFSSNSTMGSSSSTSSSSLRQELKSVPAAVASEELSSMPAISSGLGHQLPDTDKNVPNMEPHKRETDDISSDDRTDHINPHADKDHFDVEPLRQELESFPAVASEEVDVEDEKEEHTDGDAVNGTNRDGEAKENDEVEVGDEKKETTDDDDTEEDEKLSTGSSRMYDVFLSFRGVDTRNNIVGHLYKDLVARGINTYKDNINLERGSEIGPELLRAIRESRLAVIIFSKSHCSSSWCLDEVKYIMNCMKKRGQIVIPVFYHVEPTDVRKQTGPFKEDLDKQKQEKKDEWKQALFDAANLAGWGVDGDESKLIKDIVDDISSKLNRMPPSVDENLIGIDSRVQDVLVKAGSDGVRMIGIWGMPGAGKTTVARAAFSKIFNDFDVRSFVEDVSEVSKKNGLEFLQQKILSLVDEKLKVDNRHQGIELLKKRLCSRKVLLVLDDVANRDQLDKLAGARDWFGDGSRIFITTRDEHVLQEHKVDEIYNVPLLSEQEANQLVNRYAFGSNKPRKGFEKHSVQLVKYASGLPLALKVLGSFLCDKKLEEWESALDRLKKIPDKEILEKLKVSFDGLSDDEQELFLDLACFFIGWKYNKVVRILDRCEFGITIGIKVLQQKSLLIVSNERIQMHDLIQELGKSIGRNSRLWHSEKILDVIEEDESVKEIKAIVTDDPLEQPDVLEALSKMKKLGLLRVRIKPRSAKEMPMQGPRSLPNGLRWLSMHNYAPKSLPESFRGTMLVGLEMRHSSIGEIKGLGQLKFLDLSFSTELTTTPDFTASPNLKRLVLQECENLVEIHQSIGVLKCIVHISLRGCRNLTNLPHNICELPCLKSLDLKHCSRLKEIPELPSSIAILDADYCESLTRVEGLSKVYEWLWKVSFLGCSSLLKSQESRAICVAVSDNMLNQGNAVVDHWTSILLPDKKVFKWLNETGNASIVLPISPNESNEILGVSLCVVGDHCHPQFRLLLSTEDNSIVQPLPGSKSDRCSPYTWQCYISFDLLRLSFTGLKWADWIETTTDIFLIISPVTNDVDIRAAYLVGKEDVAEKSRTIDSSKFGEKTRLVCSEETTNGNTAMLLITG